MATRVIYHVVYEDEVWKVKKVGASKSSGNFDTKDKAIEYGRKLAKSETLGQLIIHKMDGKIEIEYTYGQDPSNDPV